MGYLPPDIQEKTRQFLNTPVGLGEKRVEAVFCFTALAEYFKTREFLDVAAEDEHTRALTTPDGRKKMNDAYLQVQQAAIRIARGEEPDDGDLQLLKAIPVLLSNASVYAHAAAAQMENRPDIEACDRAKRMAAQADALLELHDSIFYDRPRSGELTFTL